MARPRKEIDKDQFMRLCGMFCTLKEIAGWFHCSEDTVERWCQRELKCSFAEAFSMASCMGKISLRRYLFKLAEKNASVCIFLAKNYLGMTDKREITCESGMLLELIEGLKEPVGRNL